MMDKLHFSVVIKAPKEKVWDTMLNQDSYRAWTEPFSPGSHYVGDWNQGSKILFLAPDEAGKMGGMVSRIKENRLHEYISIEHLGMGLARQLFTDEVIEAHLTRLVKTQDADGGWFFNWSEWNPLTTLEWRGWVTIDALKVLRAYGWLS